MGSKQMESSDFEIRKELGIFGEKLGRIYLNLMLTKMDWFVTMYAFYPSDLRFKAPLIRFYQKDLADMILFLKNMISKIHELKSTIQENKLYENDTSIQGLLIRYMIRRNKTDISFYFPYRAGIAVRLREEEVVELLTLLSEVPARVEIMRAALT